MASQVQAIVAVATDSIAYAVLENIRSWKRPKDGEPRHVRDIGVWAKRDQDGVVIATGSLRVEKEQEHLISYPLQLVQVPTLEVLQATIDRLGFRRDQVALVVSHETIMPPRGLIHRSSRQFTPSAASLFQNTVLDGFPSIVYLRTGKRVPSAANQIIADFVVNFNRNTRDLGKPWGKPATPRTKKADSGHWRAERSASRRLKNMADVGSEN